MPLLLRLLPAALAALSLTACNGGSTAQNRVTSPAWGTAAAVGAGSGPLAAMNGSGNAIAIWLHPQSANPMVSDLVASRYTPGSGWSSPAVIETEDVAFNSPSEYRLAMDADGNAIAVWIQWNGSTLNLWTNRYTAGSGWGTPALLENSSDSARYPSIAMNTAGQAVVAWAQSDGSHVNLMAARYSPGGGWTAPEAVENDNGEAGVSQVALDSSGNALVVWKQDDGTRVNLWRNRYTAGSGWGTAAKLELNDNGDASLMSNGSLAMSPDGQAMVVWEQDDGGALSIWASRYTPGSGWSSPEVLENDSAGNHSPLLAMNAAGDALVVWERGDGSHSSVWARPYRSGSGWDSVQKLANDDVLDAYSPVVSMAPDGRAVAAWQQLNSSNVSDAWARAHTPANGWEAAQAIENDSTDATNLTVAMDAGGRALALWQTGMGLNFEVRFNRYE